MVGSRLNQKPRSHCYGLHVVRIRKYSVAVKKGPKNATCMQYGSLLILFLKGSKKIWQTVPIVLRIDRRSVDGRPIRIAWDMHPQVIRSHTVLFSAMRRMNYGRQLLLQHPKAPSIRLKQALCKFCSRF